MTCDPPTINIFGYQNKFGPPQWIPYKTDYLSATKPKRRNKISVLLTVCHIWPFGVKINRFIFPSAEIRPLNRLFKTLKHFFDKQIEWNPVQLKIQCKSFWDKVVEPVVWRWSWWLEDLVCRCIRAQLIEYPIKCYKLIEHSFFGSVRFGSFYPFYK